MRVAMLAGIVLVVVAACSSAASSSSEYQDLEAEVQALNGDVDILQRDLADVGEDADVREGLLDERESLEADVAALETRAASANDDVTEAEALLAQLVDERIAKGTEVASARADIEGAMQDSTSFQKAVNSYVLSLDQRACAEDIEATFARYSGSGVSADDLAPKNTDPLLDTGMSALGVSRPTGCDGWLFEGTDFWTESNIMSTLCETVDIDRLSRRPGEFQGECISGWGYVTQFDYNTGPCALHADVGPRNTAWYRYDLRVELKDSDGSCAWLDDISQQDEIQWWAIGNGVLSYDTTAGGTNAIPTLSIIRWSG